MIDTIITRMRRKIDIVRLDAKARQDVLYHDIRVGFDVQNKYRFYAGVNNLLDRDPPLGDLGTAGGSPFESFGRNFFFGFSADF